MTLADRIRRFVLSNYVEPARRQGREQITVVAGEVHRQMNLMNRVPAVVGALKSRRFEEMAGVKLLRIEGRCPSTTCRFVLRVLRPPPGSAPPESAYGPEERAEPGDTAPTAPVGVLRLECEGHLRQGIWARVNAVLANISPSELRVRIESVEGPVEAMAPQEEVFLPPGAEKRVAFHVRPNGAGAVPVRLLLAVRLPHGLIMQAHLAELRVAPPGTPGPVPGVLQVIQISDSVVVRSDIGTTNPNRPTAG